VCKNGRFPLKRFIFSLCIAFVVYHDDYPRLLCRTARPAADDTLDRTPSVAGLDSKLKS
jgi:hypothetical protein